MRRSIRALFVLLQVAGLGCYQYSLLRPGQLKPATATVPASERVAVWQHAIDVLLDEGYLPDLLNDSACFVRAKQRSDLLLDATLAMTAVVTIDPGGTVRVEIAGAGYYSSDNGLYNDLSQRQAQLLERILGRKSQAPSPSGFQPAH